MKSKRIIFRRFLNLSLILGILFIPWCIGYVINNSVLSGFIYVGCFILGNIVGSLLGMAIVRFIKRK